MDTRQLFNSFDVYFDDRDRRNGSLYLCLLRGENNGAAVEPVVTLLRQHALWADDGLACVRDDQRETYASQLDLIEYREYLLPHGQLTAVRCDHPRYPSDGGRWNAWVQCLDLNLNGAPE